MIALAAASIRPATPASSLLTERDGEVIGHTYSGVEGTDYMSLRGPAGVMYDIVVDPAHRKQGRLES